MNGPYCNAKSLEHLMQHAIGVPEFLQSNIQAMEYSTALFDPTYASLVMTLVLYRVAWARATMQDSQNSEGHDGIEQGQRGQKKQRGTVTVSAPTVEVV
jgi:hypothetical protein